MKGRTEEGGEVEQSGEVEWEGVTERLALQTSCYLHFQQNSDLWSSFSVEGGES